MSRAFVKEPDGSEIPEELPDIPISEHRNFVTKTGLEQIENKIAELNRALQKVVKAEDKNLQAQYERDLRYWNTRRATAELIPPAKDNDKVLFGTSVTIESASGKKKFRIVGQDEADPSNGLLSYVSPLAAAMLGKHVGDEVEFGDNHAEIIMIEI